MEGFSDIKGFTSSTPTKHQYLQRSGESNENDQLDFLDIQNPRKSKVKHFMSPTISEATKAAAVQKKKVLADRNEALTITNSPVTPKTPILDSRTSPIFSGTNGGVEGKATFDTDSSSKNPYLTNYLSPRPKFLRYNPNMRRKMFLHGENEVAERKNGFVGDELSGSVDSQKEVGEETPSDEGEKEEDSLLKGDDEELVKKNEGNDSNDDDEEEMEEGFEEESCWSLKGALKFLLVLGALFLSTSYTCSMNSPDPSPIKEAMWDVRDGFQNFQSNVFEVVARGNFFESGNQVSYTGRDEALLWLLGRDERNMDDKFVEEEIVEKDDASKELVESAVGLGQVDELENEQSEDVYNDALVSNFKVPGPVPGSEIVSNGKVVVENGKVAEVPMEVSVVAITKLVPLIVCCTLVTALLLGPLVSLYCLRQKKSAKKEDNLPTEAPIAETSVAVAAAGKISLVVCNVKEGKKLEKIESSVGPASSFRLGNEAPSEDFSRHSQAPIVELLGELVIGEVSSSFKRRKISDIVDESNRISASTENLMISRSKASSSQIQGQPSLMDVSKADSSPSFRSFAAEKKKISGKKEESMGEQMSISTSTPVRRSSRIRNRVMSP